MRFDLVHPRDPYIRLLSGHFSSSGILPFGVGTRGQVVESPQNGFQNGLPKRVPRVPQGTSPSFDHPLDTRMLAGAQQGMRK